MTLTRPLFMFTDMVATLGDVTATSALKYIKQKMEQDPVGQQILRFAFIFSVS
jgi:ubiquinone biosynthesis protein Coq4